MIPFLLSNTVSFMLLFSLLHFLSLLCCPLFIPLNQDLVPLGYPVTRFLGPSFFPSTLTLLLVLSNLKVLNIISMLIPP